MTLMIAVPCSAELESEPRTTAPSNPPATAPEEKKTEKLTIGDEPFKLELAADEAAREKGLMHRAELEPDGGMLFIFPDSHVRSFWMAQCLIDIDVAFLDEHGRIVAIYQMKKEQPRRRWESQGEYEARLKRYPSIKPARFAIELKAGTMQRLQLKRGQTIDMDLDRLKALAK